MDGTVRCDRRKRTRLGWADGEKGRGWMDRAPGGGGGCGMHLRWLWGTTVHACRAVEGGGEAGGVAVRAAEGGSLAMAKSKGLRFH